MSKENSQPIFHIQRIYLKSLSLDLPDAPTIFLEQQSPEIEVAINVAGQTLAEGIYESMVTVKVTARIKDKVAFVIEGKQAGIFEVRHIHGNQLSRSLGIGCPAIVYPYLRSTIAEAVLHAGFPPVHLAEIDFEMIYQQNSQEEPEQQTAQEFNLQSAPIIH